MHIAIEGCCHGELRKIYASLLRIEKAQNLKIELLLICGDFQSIRNGHDLSQISVPDKFKEYGDFHKYYSGIDVAPIPTIFIGGNHEASNYLWELYHGGYVAPNIYYLGAAGVVNFAGLRIAGLSGIYKSHNYNQGFFETYPLRGGDIKSVYHVRQFSVFQMAQIKEKMDIFLSHDWPLGIAKHGNLPELMRFKSFLRKEIEENTLGSPPAEMLMKMIKPDYWFSAHLHVKYAAVYNHQTTTPKPVDNPDEINLSSSDEDEDGDAGNASTPQEAPKITKFLALDKCLPKRQFLQVLELPESNENYKIQLDPEWLSIVRATSSFTPFTRDGNTPKLPTQEEVSRAIIQARQWVDEQGPSLLQPPSFCMTADALTDDGSGTGNQAIVYSNPQTELFCSNLGIENQINKNGVHVEHTFHTFDEEVIKLEDPLEIAKRRLLEKIGL